MTDNLIRDTFSAGQFPLVGEARVDLGCRMKRNFVGQKVRRLRKERSMTQSELAARIGIIQSDLCRMEKGEYRVGLDTLFKILEVFGMNIGEFFDERGMEDGPADGENELLERYRRLSDEARVEVMDYIRFKEQQERRSEPMTKATTAVE